VGGGHYHGGMLHTRGGHLHALNWALGLARAARQEGALLFEQSPVTAIEPAGGGWRLRTAEGEARAENVLVAANGYLRGLVPEIEARVMPINNFIAVTEPLGRERAESLIRGGYAVSDSRFVVYYFRITPDHRLLFGGGENYSLRFPEDVAGFVRRHMLRVYPQLADVRLDNAWGGTLAVTPHRLPYVREVAPGLYGIGGYSGLGVVLAPYFGKLIADRIAGRSEDFDALARLPVPRFPGGKLLRWPTLVAAMSWFALRDRL
jgi:gamma-glutamylputrescine oxidase